MQVSTSLQMTTACDTLSTKTVLHPALTALVCQSQVMQFCDGLSDLQLDLHELRQRRERTMQQSPLQHGAPDCQRHVSGEDVTLCSTKNTTTCSNLLDTYFEVGTMHGREMPEQQIVSKIVCAIVFPRDMCLLACLDVAVGTTHGWMAQLGWRVPGRSGEMYISGPRRLPIVVAVLLKKFASHQPCFQYVSAFAAA